MPAQGEESRGFPDALVCAGRMKREGRRCLPGPPGQACTGPVHVKHYCDYPCGPQFSRGSKP